jgi:phage terminase Nu1 subunit (DNA packaging protein)
MDCKELTAGQPRLFEDLKQVNAYGAEYWSARDLQPLLGYTQWRRFEDAIQRAITSCQQSGNAPDHHFASAGKPIVVGKSVEQIKKFKKIDDKDNLMDRMNTTELAANQFRMTQAREKFKREKIKGQERAIEVHKKVGREVRQAIERIGGTLPEHIPPAEHIRQVEKRIKSIAPKVELEEKDAKGLIGGPKKNES